MEQLQASLEEIVKTHPPQKRYGEDNHRGLFVGPVGLAYLFLQLSNRYPSLRISEYSLREWAQKYTEADRGTLTLKQGRCGLIDEKVSFEAVRACVTQDPKDVDAFLENIPKLLGKNVGTEPMDFDSDILYGRSGALYLLRMIRHWVPGSAETVQPHIVDLANRILETGGDDARGWRWNGRWYLGAVHGDIGIITQLVLSIPELAPKLSGRLEALLDLQDEEGNWPAYEPATETETDLGRVQLCHGAPGFIYALWALRPYFPELHQRIDDAITKAQGVTWTRGMLKKEPSLCHGLFGNGL